MDYIQKSIQKTPSTSRTCDTSQLRSKFRRENFEKFKEKYKNGLKTFYEQEKNLRLNEVEVVNKHDRSQTVSSRIKESVVELKLRNEEKVKKHKENMRSLVVERKNRVEKIMNRSTRLSVNVKEKEKVLRTRSVMQESIEESDVDEKLEDFYRKIAKSARNNQKFLKIKVEKVKAERRTRSTVNSCESLKGDYADIALNIMKKQESACMVRNRLKKEFYDKVANRSSRVHDRLQKISKKNEEEKENRIGKSRNLAEISAKKSSFIQEIKKKQRKEIEWNKERHKLFEVDAFENITRDKRIFAMKKQKIIEKHQELQMRQAQQHHFLDMVNKKIREKAMDFTKERERLLLIKAKISKAKTPESVKKKFKF